MSEGKMKTWKAKGNTGLVWSSGYLRKKKTYFQSRDVQICVTFVDYLAQISILSDLKLSNTCLNVIFEKQSIQAS